MKEIYVLSGLGADERAFRSVDFSTYKVNFVQWISPQADESIEHYAERLLSQIHSERPKLLGLSFGGMMAVEISKLIETEKIILISSAKTKNEVPFYFRWAGFLRLNSIVPIALLKKSNLLTNWFFGATDHETKKLLKTILDDTDPIYLKWAIHQIVNWRNEYTPKNLTHVHGSSDKLLPLKNCDFTIENGGHLMILNKAEEISSLLPNLF